MTSLTTDLAELLGTVQHPGDFATTGRLDIFVPRLEVTGVGQLALPLLPVQAQQLIASAEQAPYGKGEATLVDTAVRRTWQINPERLQISGRRWEQTLADIVGEAATGLGWPDPWRRISTNSWCTTRGVSSSAIAIPRRPLGCSPP